MSPWNYIRLGEVLEEDRCRVAVEDDHEYRIAGVLIAGRGLFWRETIDGADTRYTHLYRVRANQLVYRKLTAWEGPITVVPDEFGGAFVSAEFPTFSLDTDQIIPNYLRLLCRQTWLHDRIKSHSTGTAERRNRLKPDDLKRILVPLPPLEAQSAIAEAATVMETALDAMDTELEAAARLRRALLEDRLRDAAAVPLDDLVDDIRGGRSPKAQDRQTVDGERGVLKVSAIRPGDFRWAEHKALEAATVMPKHALVRQGDVLLNRASGSLKLVASVCRVRATPDRPLYLSDKTLRLEPRRDRVDPDYLVSALASRQVREQIETEAEGSSGQRNVSQNELRAIEVPVVDDQVAFVTELAAVDGLRQALMAQRNAAARTQHVAVRGLLTGHLFTGGPR